MKKIVLLSLIALAFCVFPTKVLAQTCEIPYDFSVTSIAERTATLKWNLNDGTKTSFDLVVSKEQLSDPLTGQLQDVTVADDGGIRRCTLTHLTPDTHYHVYIRTDCGNDSNWCSVEFNTLPLRDCGSPQSQSIVVADGTVENDTFPFWGMHSDDAPQKTQSIYPNSMLSDLYGKTITNLKYYVRLRYPYGYGNIEYDIRMMTTDQSTLSDFVSTENATLVYSGSLNPNDSCMEITLNTPFEYTGGNLLIEFELKAIGNGMVCDFYGTEESAYVSYAQKYNSSHQSKFLPKLEFMACEEAPACPEVTDIAVTDIGDYFATISWTRSAGTYANTSDIYYSTTIVDDFTNIVPQITGITGTSQLITGLAQDTTYYVYVRTHCDKDNYDDGISGWAGGISFPTPLCCHIPGTPEVAVTGKHTATVTWTNTSGDAQQADNFTYILSTTPIAGAALDNTTATACDSTHVNLANLKSETTYHFYVRNVCADSECSSPWDSCQFTTPVAMPAVINLQAHDIAHNAFTATWESDTANFADEAEWEVACVAHGAQPTTWTTVFVPEYFIFGLEDSTTYDFYVRAKNSDSYSANAKIEVTTLSIEVTYDCKDVIINLYNSTVNPVPVSSGYSGSYTVQIYTANELSASTAAGYIRKVAFYQTYCQNTSDSSRYRKKTTLWMGNTNKEIFDSNQEWIHGLTQVMSEKPIDFNKNGDWVELQLDNPFFWDGTSNLVVAMLAYSNNVTQTQFAGYDKGNAHLGTMCVGGNGSSWSVTDGVPSYTNGARITGALADIKLCYNSCRPVANLKVDSITATTARARWYPGDDETKWYVYNSTTEMSDDELAALEPDDCIEVTTNPVYNLTGLSQDHDYHFYVRAACGGAEGNSLWTEYSYATPVVCSAPDKAVCYQAINNTIVFTATAGELGTVGSYDYRYWMTGLDDTDTVTVVGESSPFTVTGLTVGATYDWEVRANCTDTDGGPSRWVKGNRAHVCGTADLPYFSDFAQYEDDFVPDCWTMLEGMNNRSFVKISNKVLAFKDTSSIATPRFSFTAGDYNITMELSTGCNDGQLDVMFATDLSDESTYDTIHTIDFSLTKSFNATLPLHIAVDTAGYIVLSQKSHWAYESHISHLNIEHAADADDCRELIVGYDGNTKYTPVYSNWDASYSVQIYTADELKGQDYQAGDLSSISFYQTYCQQAEDSSRYRKATTVWMGNTTKESFSGSNDWIAGLTQVMRERPIDFNKNGDWVELALDSTFSWDGESNLAVAVLAYSEKYTQMSFRGGVTDGVSRSIYAYQDDVTPTIDSAGVPSIASHGILPSRANIKLCYALGSCPTVTDITVSDITATSATARWTSRGEETTWHVYNSTTKLTAAEIAALTQSEYTVVDTMAYNLAGLNQDNDYYIYVRAACDADNVSRWRSYKYTTLCSCSTPVSPTATSVADNSITFTATAGEVGTVSSYDYRYWRAGSGDTVTVVEQSPFTVNDISGGLYEWEVRANCTNTDGGPSHWVKGNRVYVCGTADLPYYNDFEQYGDGSMPDCWTVLDTATIDGDSLPVIYDGLLFFSGVSSIATPQFSFPAGDYGITVNFLEEYASNEMSLMFATDLDDKSTYTTIYSIDLSLYEETFNATLPLHFDADATGYIVLSHASCSECFCALQYLKIEHIDVDDDCSEFVVGNDGNVYPVPIYGQNNASYVVQIYTADELNAQGYQAGDISNIAFYQTQYNGSEEKGYENAVTVWMGSTVKEKFDSVRDWIPGLTQVMSEKSVNFNKNGDWVELPLDNTFSWDGTSNLAVAVLANPVRNSEGNDCYFRGAYSSDNVRRTVFVRNSYDKITVTDGVPSSSDTYQTSSRANIKLCYALGSCPAVTDITVSDITTTSATAHWTARGDETAWHVYNSATMLTAAEIAALESDDYTVVHTTAYNLAGLNQDNDYYLYVRAACDADNVSWWKYCKYTTLCSCSTPVSPVATSMADNSITFAATAGEVGTVGSYDFRYWITGSDDTVAVAGVQSPFTVTGLTVGDIYDWEVRANCTSTVGGPSRWVKGNRVHVCGTVDLPYFSDFGQYENGSVPDCWTVLDTATIEGYYPLVYSPVIYEDFLFLSDVSSIATPRFSFPAGDYGITMKLDIYDKCGQMDVMFATDLGDESTYDTIYSIDMSLYNTGVFNATLPLHIAANTTGYIVLSRTGANGVCQLYLLKIENADIDGDCSEFVLGYEGGFTDAPVFSNFDASYTVQIYTAGELNAQGYQAGDISSIAFHQTDYGGNNERAYRKATTVWIGNTTKESFISDNDWIAGLTQVMSEKPIDFNKKCDWVELALDNTFYWDGESNLAVAVLAYSEDYTHMSFRGGKTDDVNRTIFAYQDNITPTIDSAGVPSMTIHRISPSRANIKLCFDPGIDVVKDNVTYTICGTGNDNMKITKAAFDEDDLTAADFDITYAPSDTTSPASSYLNYKHKLDVPATLTDGDVTYTIVATHGDAFDGNGLNDTVRVNIPAEMEVVGKPKNDKIAMKISENEMLYNGNKYYVSKAYKVNLCDGAALTQRPFGYDQTLNIECPSVAESEIGDNTGVFKAFTGAKLSFPKNSIARKDPNNKNLIEARLNEDEVTIDVNRLSKIRIAKTAVDVALDDFIDENCEEVMFQADLVGRTYPECFAVANIPLDGSTKIKAEFALNNKEYYYFSLPFDCIYGNIRVKVGTTDVIRCNSIEDAVNSTETAVHHYVLFKWDESAYTSDTTTGYAAYYIKSKYDTLKKNKGYVIAIVESADWYEANKNNPDTSLAVIATFTASNNYTEIASSESEVEIPVTRADAMNAYSGWNLVGNPFYGSVRSSQYSFNKYVRKVLFDRGDTAKVEDYAPNIPVLNAEIKPFETVFIQKSDAAGNGTVTVSGTSPEQDMQRAPAILPEYVTITLNDNSRMIDRTTIISNVLSSDDFLQQEDLLKGHQSSNEIYTQYGDFDFSFNEMNISEGEKVIPLAVKVAAEGDYTIAMSSELSNYNIGDVVLHDKTLETYVKLSDGESETLHLMPGATEGRLELVIKVDEVITITDDTEDKTNGIAVYVHDGIATIEGIEAGAIVTIVDATGKTLHVSEATGDRIDYQFAVRGVYMITVRNNANVNTVKVVY